MHSLYAEILDITPLALNNRYRVNDGGHDAYETPEPCHLSAILWEDIKLATTRELTCVFKAERIEVQGASLYLPAEQLSSAQKRQLWTLLSE
ncbi:hypothetical protein [Pseudoalteromonas byunsanensis]|uniref:Uncharacterized protein n=1 Tax=Pseudoalteromonas byunsanensis TaxID=327939 RepID=A0A1S1N3W9_9GAMM|nr:hypothetical protein [Pseudoalteromonas byunsanensis]OHU94098.1 hypothetical protein BIW53_17960 [Pseudoalteromonas byunsanensis]